VASYARFLGLRYVFSRQRSRFTVLVSFASMLGMTLGVASLITVLSVMNGFAAELQGRILALVPHAYVELQSAEQSGSAQTELLGVDEAAANGRGLSARLLAHPAVSATAPFVRETVLLSGPYRQQGAILTGLDVAAQRAVTQLDAYLIAGNLEALQKPFSVILGSALARTLGVVPGDRLRVVLPQVTTTPLGLFPRSRLVTVVGLFEVGAQQDSQLAYSSLDTARRLVPRGGARGLQLRTVDLLQAAELGPRLEPLLQGQGRYRPWTETQGSLFQAIRMEKITVSILLLGVVLVAAFNIVSTLVMAVTEKRRDIAVLRSMGATPGAIASIFLTQGLVLAVLGVVLGTILGVLLALNIADVVAFFERLFGAAIFDPQVYFISRLPARLEWTDVLFITLAALLLSVFAALYPAWRASTVAPAEVLRYE
jgi:lipoprotein-releasing system permease protein